MSLFLQFSALIPVSAQRWVKWPANHIRVQNEGNDTNQDRHDSRWAGKDNQRYPIFGDGIKVPVPILLLKNHRVNQPKKIKSNQPASRIEGNGILNGCELSNKAILALGVGPDMGKTISGKEMVHASQKVVGCHDRMEHPLIEHGIAQLFPEQVAESSFTVLCEHDLLVDESNADQCDQEHEGTDRVRNLQWYGNRL